MSCNCNKASDNARARVANNTELYKASAQGSLPSDFETQRLEGVKMFFVEIPAEYTVKEQDLLYNYATKSNFTAAKACNCAGQNKTMTVEYVNDNKTLYMVAKQVLKAAGVPYL